MRDYRIETPVYTRNVLEPLPCAVSCVEWHCQRRRPREQHLNKRQSQALHESPEEQSLILQTTWIILVLGALPMSLSIADYTPDASLFTILYTAAIFSALTFAICTLAVPINDYREEQLRRTQSLNWWQRPTSISTRKATNTLWYTYKVPRNDPAHFPSYEFLVAEFDKEAPEQFRVGAMFWLAVTLDRLREVQRVLVSAGAREEFWGVAREREWLLGELWEFDVQEMVRRKGLGEELGTEEERRERRYKRPVYVVGAGQSPEVWRAPLDWSFAVKPTVPGLTARP